MERRERCHISLQGGPSCVDSFLLLPYSGWRSSWAVRIWDRVRWGLMVLCRSLRKDTRARLGKTSKTAEVGLEASEAWTTSGSQTVNVASDNKRTLFLESGGSRATKGGDLDVASFVTRIRLTPDDGDVNNCVLEKFGTDFSPNLNTLFGKLASNLSEPVQVPTDNNGRLFDFQVSKGDLSLGVFNLQWEDDDGVFSVGIAPSLGFPIKGFTPPNTVVTLVVGNINDATSPRVFEISGGLAAVAQRVANNQGVVLTCANDHVTTVTVSAVTN